MKCLISSALLIASAVAASQHDIMNFLGLKPQALTYTNAVIPYKNDLMCESCIRGGYEYCYWFTLNPQSQVTELSWNCTETMIVPPFSNKTDNLPDSHACSSGVED